MKRLLFLHIIWLGFGAFGACKVIEPDYGFTDKMSGACSSIEKDCSRIAGLSHCGNSSYPCSQVIDSTCTYTKTARRRQCEEYRKICKERVSSCVKRTREYCKKTPEPHEKGQREALPENSKNNSHK